MSAPSRGNGEGRRLVLPPTSDAGGAEARGPVSLRQDPQVDGGHSVAEGVPSAPLEAGPVVVAASRSLLPAPPAPHRLAPSAVLGAKLVPSKHPLGWSDGGLCVWVPARPIDLVRTHLPSGWPQVCGPPVRMGGHRVG